MLRGHHNGGGGSGGGGSRAWEKVETSSRFAEPPAVGAHTAVLDPHLRVLHVFGGAARLGEGPAESEDNDDTEKEVGMRNRLL